MEGMYLSSAAGSGWGSVAKDLSVMEKAVISGWIKNRMITPLGVCMLGAYMFGCSLVRYRDSDGYTAVGGLLEEVIRARPGNPVPVLFNGWAAVIYFNDLPGTSKDDVLDVIREARAIAVAREESDCIPDSFLARLPELAAA